MYNTLMIVLMVLFYAVASDMDYRDSELLSGRTEGLAMSVSCSAPDGDWLSAASQL